MLGGKYAVIDIGSNSVRMAIWEIQPGGSYRVIDRARETIRLSEGMTQSKNIAPESMLRGMAAMQIFAQMIKSYEVEHVIAVGTAALRKAENRELFTQNVLQATGINIAVISGQQETTYAYSGVINTTGLNDFVMIDTGGGSCEIALVLNRTLVDSISAPLGCVVLTEKFLSDAGSKPPNAKSLDALNEYVKKNLSGIRFLKRAQGLPIIAIGGSNRAIGMMSINHAPHPISRLHGHVISAREVETLTTSLYGMSASKRKKVLNFDYKRQDVIIAGVTPLLHLSQMIKSQQVNISESGLREGVLFETLYDGVQRTGEQVISDSLDNAILLYGANLAHARDVTRVALSLFTQLKGIANLPDAVFTPLHAAAMLHDIGSCVDYDAHEVHGYYLVLNSLLTGLTRMQQMSAAYMVARHRMTVGRFNDEVAACMPKESTVKLDEACALLRLAERLCRYDSASIKSVECFCDDKRLQLMIRSNNPVLVPMLSGMIAENDFPTLYGRRLSIL